MDRLDKLYALQVVAATLVFIFSINPVLAAVPLSLNYQGHLTDSAGVAIDGSVNMVFTLYDLESGGAAQWNDARSVTIEQGVFSVELGDTSNPFPLGLFENPLWIGLTIDADAEMSPRRPISSVGFSFKADDANTLEGVSASTLDQSLHVLDTGNPHNVTASQVGAADLNELASHMANTTNPHTVTAVQTGAASSGDFITHTANSAAHHLRYTNIEAVATMGAKNNTNALNHDKYTNANAIAAILAADGAGSTLDSDKVDGLEASEIIDAAQDEVRTPISSLPFTITQSGSYYLTGNLSGASGGIDINASNVTLDMMGFTIDGGGAVADNGIAFTGSNNVTIRNGTVTGFGWTGIYQNSTSAYEARLFDMKVMSNGVVGSGNIDHSGIVLRGSYSHIERCTSGINGGVGIIILGGSRLIDNTVFANGYYGIYADNGATIRGNIVYRNSDGGIFGNDSTSLISNTVYDNGGLHAIHGGNGSVISDNTVYNNTANHNEYGIYGGVSSIISGNNVHNCDVTTGIFSGRGSTIRNNSVSYTSSTYGIFGEADVEIIGNTVYANSGWGIFGVYTNHIKDNIIYSNNISDDTGKGGLRVANESSVIGNTLDSNLRNNIYVFSTGNAIENNHFKNSTNGLNFVTNQNFFANNRGHNNTNNYVNTNMNTNGGGNVEY